MFERDPEWKFYLKLAWGITWRTLAWMGGLILTLEVAIQYLIFRGFL